MDDFLLQDIYAESSTEKFPGSHHHPWMDSSNEQPRLKWDFGWWKGFGLSLVVATEEWRGLGLCSSLFVECLPNEGHPFIDLFKSEDFFILSGKDTYSKSKNMRYSIDGINRSYMLALQCSIAELSKEIRKPFTVWGQNCPNEYYFHYRV